MLLHVAEALSAALAANVVHMDLKTNNIMIDDAVTFAAGPVPEWCVVAAAHLDRVTLVCEVDLGAAGYHAVHNCIDVLAHCHGPLCVHAQASHRGGAARSGH